ncbi:hypothetical protein G6F22_017769 [Rhizopus arrhizus]|nr:hypothetical protein G6F22_017769 [Rhizopus arrhizus]
MVALAGPLGDFHVAQQRVHLWNGQAPIGTHRAMAGHGRQQFVARTRHAPALAVFAQVGQHVAQQPFRLGMRQQRRNAAHMQRTGAGTGHFEAERGQRFGFAFSGVGLALAHGKGDRHQQRLRLQADAIMRVLQALVADALVRRMHVDHDQAFGILGQDVDAVQLRDRIAQRRHARIGAGHRQSILARHRRQRRPAFGTGRCGIQRGIGGRGVGHLQAQRLLRSPA